MFVLQKEPRWTWPVMVRMPLDGGGFEARQFRAVFRFVSEARRQELGPSEAGIIAILSEAVVELLDVVDENKQPIPHSAELLAALLALPWVRAGLLHGYAEALAGQPISKAAEGN